MEKLDTEPALGIGWYSCVSTCSGERPLFAAFCFHLRSKCLVSFNLIDSSWAMTKADAKVGKAVDEQKDQVILMDNFL